MQSQGKKVMLVDCDLRRPSQAKIFGIDVKEGTSLTNLLDGSAKITKEAIYYDPVSHLPLLLSDKGSRNSTEYLKEAMFRRLITRLREPMDIIILDTPPMSVMADAEAIAAVADISILVVQYNRALAADINDAIDELKKYRCHMSGVILNNVHTLPGTRRMIVGSYYGRYGYGNYGNYGRYGAYGAYGHYAERKDPTASAKKKTSVKERPEEAKETKE